MKKYIFQATVLACSIILMSTETQAVKKWLDLTYEAIKPHVTKASLTPKKSGKKVMRAPLFKEETLPRPALSSYGEKGSHKGLAVLDDQFIGGLQRFGFITHQHNGDDLSAIISHFQRKAKQYKAPEVNPHLVLAQVGIIEACLQGVNEIFLSPLELDIATATHASSGNISEETAIDILLLNSGNNLSQHLYSFCKRVVDQSNRNAHEMGKFISIYNEHEIHRIVLAEAAAWHSIIGVLEVEASKKANPANELFQDALDTYCDILNVKRNE